MENYTRFDLISGERDYIYGILIGFSNGFFEIKDASMCNSANKRKITEADINYFLNKDRVKNYYIYKRV